MHFFCSFVFAVISFYKKVHCIGIDLFFRVIIVFPDISCVIFCDGIDILGKDFVDVIALADGEQCLVANFGVQET